jgi:hypothetical protein
MRVPGPSEEGRKVSESEQRVFWRLLRRGLGSGERVPKTAPQGRPFLAFSQQQ